MIDAVLAETRAVQRRLRDLPSRVVVYLLLAGCLFAELGYPQVWHRLVAGLDGLDVAAPTAAALTQARRRVGVKPVRALFDLLRGPAAAPSAIGVYWRGLLVCAIDGTTMTVADSTANLTRFTKQRGGITGGSSYPLMRVMTLVCCGTRTIIDAVFGLDTIGETTYVPQLTRDLRQQMIVLADRNFAAANVIAAIAATGADELIRGKTGSTARKLPIQRRLPDGSYLSMFGDTPVRVIECDITIATSTGRRTGTHRLAATRLDHRQYPASDLVTLYHQRWDIESDVLRTWRRKHLTERIAWGPAYRNTDDLAFTRENGAPLDPSTVTARFKQLVKENSGENKPRHHLRHGRRASNSPLASTSPSCPNAWATPPSP